MTEFNMGRIYFDQCELGSASQKKTTQITPGRNQEGWAIRQQLLGDTTQMNQIVVDALLQSSLLLHTIMERERVIAQQFFALSLTVCEGWLRSCEVHPSATGDSEDDRNVYPQSIYDQTYSVVSFQRVASAILRKWS